MMKGFKKGVVAAAALAMAATSLTGCGTKTIDGSATVAVCNEENISMGVVALYTRLQQSQTYSMYASYFGSTEIFSMVMDEESGETYGEQIKDSAMDDIETFYLLRSHAADYDVELTEDELASITAAAETFMAANDADALAATGITQDAVEELMNLYTYQSKMYTAMIADVDTEVSDEEAAQAKVTYVEISLDGTTDEDGNTVELTEDEIQAKKDQADAVLTKVVEAGADADMDALAKEVDENLSAVSSTYDADSTSVDSAIKEAVDGLADGTIVETVITSSDETSLYVVRFDTALDRDATDTEKESIISTRQQDDFNAEVEEWLGSAAFEIKEDVWKLLKVNDTQIYNIVTDDTTTE